MATGADITLPRLSSSEGSSKAGQALVEFSLVAPLFFFLLFFGLTAGFYTLERAGAVDATTAGARIGAGAQAGNLNQPALAAARVETARLAASALPGTRIAFPARVTDPCPTEREIEAAVVYICASAPTATTVKVEIVGHPASFVSPRAGGLTLPLDTYAVVHTAVFKR